MSLSPVAKSLIEAGISLVKDNGGGFIDAFKRHDWKVIAYDVVDAELTLASAAGVPGAAIALKLLPVGTAVLEYAIAHPGVAHQPEGNGNVIVS